MLIQNIDVNALKKNEKETSHDKGGDAANLLI